MVEPALTLFGSGHCCVFGHSPGAKYGENLAFGAGNGFTVASGAELWFNERKRRQQDALQIVRRVATEGAGRDKAEAALRAYIDRWSRSPREEYRSYSEALASFNCAFAANLHNTTSAAQRQTAVQKLKGWEADVRSLAADAAK